MEDATPREQELKQGKAAPPTHPQLVRLQQLIVNSYLVGEPGVGTWAVIDTGLGPFSASKIIRAAESRFGRGSKPSAIVLTHGHFDHVGAIHRLVKYWDVPVFAHELELPYLTGRSAYPPPDPTVGGGLMARLAGLYPRQPINLGKRVHALGMDGVVPGLPGWRWIHTPGHSPGHVSLFRFSDRVLIAGDAFVTVKQESLFSVLRQSPRVSRPPAYFTPNWEAARTSLETLLGLEPELAATGHGPPMSGETLREELRDLVRSFDTCAVPAHGRYIGRPALTDESGVVLVPPPVPDPVPGMLAAGVAGVAVLLLLRSLGRKRPARGAVRSEG
jgi:glyoxylase-like metal-dependent hydrolase (beta-lactamase superfamily II)